LHLVGILFPPINDDARSKLHQISNLLSYSDLLSCFVLLLVYEVFCNCN
jgi:hypothetical protein